jgi:hypothetical protein
VHSQLTSDLPYSCSLSSVAPLKPVRVVEPYAGFVGHPPAWTTLAGEAVLVGEPAEACGGYHSSEFI